MFQEATIQYFPTFKKMTKHQEVVAFTCGLLPDPSPLVNLAYTLFITEHIYYESECPHLEHGAVLFESLYRESNIPLPGHHFQNQFINYYKQSYFRDISGSADRLYPNHPIYRPSRVFVFSSLITGVALGGMNKKKDITDSEIYICQTIAPLPDNLFPTCCRISEDQPIAKLVMYQVTFRYTTEPCMIKISEKNFWLVMHLVAMPTRLMTHLMEPISQASRVDFMKIDQTSLSGVKSFNLENKAASLLNLSLHLVDMDADLCASLLKQIPSLTNLNFLQISPRNRNTKIFELQGNEKFCHIPRDMCSQILRSVSRLYHLVHLDVSGNTLTGCLSNLLSDPDSGLPLLQRLYLRNTKIFSGDVNHIIHIIETGKLPKLETLNLIRKNLRGMDNEIDRLLNAALNYQKRELVVHLQGDSFPRHLVEKWQTQCSGKAVKVIFSDSEDVEDSSESQYLDNY